MLPSSLQPQANPTNHTTLLWSPSPTDDPIARGAPSADRHLLFSFAAGRMPLASPLNTAIARAERHRRHCRTPSNADLTFFFVVGNMLPISFLTAGNHTNTVASLDLHDLVANDQIQATITAGIFLVADLTLARRHNPDLVLRSSPARRCSISCRHVRSTPGTTPLHTRSTQIWLSLTSTGDNQICRRPPDLDLPTPALKNFSIQRTNSSDTSC